MVVSFRRVATIAALAASALIGVTSPAGARPAASGATASGATASGPAGAGVVTTGTYSSYLVRLASGGIRYSPNQISGPVVTHTVCNSTAHSVTTFTLLNKTGVTQQLTLGGQPFLAPLKANYFMWFCAYHAGTYSFGVVNHPLAHLSVTVP
jgi:hypothetical protein